MPRYIDADALLKHEIEADRMGAMLVVGKGYILSAPEVDAVPVVRGEWIDSPTGDYAICSYCHVEWNVFDNDTYRFRHCPACGAKMVDKP